MDLNELYRLATLALNEANATVDKADTALKAAKEAQSRATETHREVERLVQAQWKERQAKKGA